MLPVFKCHLFVSVDWRALQQVCVDRNILLFNTTITVGRKDNKTLLILA